MEHTLPDGLELKPCIFPTYHEIRKAKGPTLAAMARSLDLPENGSPTEIRTRIRETKKRAHEEETCQCEDSDIERPPGFARANLGRDGRPKMMERTFWNSLNHRGKQAVVDAYVKGCARSAPFRWRPIGGWNYWLELMGPGLLKQNQGTDPADGPTAN